MKRFKTAIVAILIAVSLTACSSSWENELERAGFTSPEVAQEATSSRPEVIMATAGDCRIRFVVNDREGRIYATVPGSSTVEGAEFVGDPSLELLKRDERFAHCFNEQAEA